MNLDLNAVLGDESPEDLDDTPLTFGKHQGKTPDEISEEDPSYIVWMWETVEVKHCSRGMYNYCKAQAGDKFDDPDLRELDDMMREAFED